jgi:putative hydrolase of the HAD superfamily
MVSISAVVSPQKYGVIIFGLFGALVDIFSRQE